MENSLKATPLKLGWPNRLTIGRILLVGPFVVCLLNMDKPQFGWLRWAAIVIFALMSLSDLLDGFLARRLHQESDLGKFLDPLADKLLITTAVVILCVLGVREATIEPAARTLYLPNWVAVAVIGKDLLVSVGAMVVYLMTGAAFIEARPLGKWCTTVQLLLVLAMLLWLDLPAWLTRLPEVLWVAATILSAAAVLDYVKAGTRHLAETSAAAQQDDHPERQKDEEP